MLYWLFVSIVLFGSMLFKMIFPVVLNKTARESSYCGYRAAFLCLNVTAASPWPTAEPAHAQQNEQALLPSLNRSLNEYTFHPLAVNARCIQRVLADIVAIMIWRNLMDYKGYDNTQLSTQPK